MIARKKPRDVDFANVKLLRSEDIKKLYQVTYKWITKQIKENGFPRPIEISYKRYRWRKKDVEEWFDKIFDED